MSFLRQSFLVLVFATALHFLNPITSFHHLLQQLNEPAPVKLYGSRLSTCTRRVAVVLKEKKVPYQFIPIDLGKGEHKHPQYLENRQPFGQVPVLADGDIHLFESRAISRYIASKYAGRGSSLLPPPHDIVRVGQFEQAASIEQANFDIFASGIASELVFKPMRGGQTDHKRVEVLNATLDEKLNGYERILAKQKYLAGNEVTLADLFHLPYGAMITKKLGFQLLTTASRPNVARWWHDISSREAWLAVEDGA